MSESHTPGDRSRDQLRRCRSDGLLVGHRKAIYPAEPFDAALGNTLLTVGCNQLRCQVCGCAVKSHPELAWTRVRARLAEAYALDRAQLLSGGYAGRSSARAYHCTCRAVDVVAPQSVHGGSEADELVREPSPWSCAGHPPLRLPAVVDGVVLEHGMDWGPLIEESLRGQHTRLAASAAAWGRDWPARIYGALEDRAEAAQLARAVLALATDDDPAVCVAALGLLVRNPGAASDGLPHRFDEAPATFDRPHPHLAEQTLGELFDEALSARLTQKDVSPELVGWARRRAAERSPRSSQLAAALASLDETVARAT
jgi:hypothetical protein